MKVKDLGFDMKKYLSSMTESPQMVSGTNFGLDDDLYNSKKAKEFLSKKNKEIIEETDDYILFRTGDNRKGNITLITKDSLPKINYQVNYH